MQAQLDQLFAPIEVSSKQFNSAGVTNETYDAVSGGKRRKSVAGSSQSEDRLLLTNSRKRLAGNARDLNRNFAIVAWAIRRHLDYVTQFQFHGNTKDRGFNAELERVVDTFARKRRFDAAGRHGLPMMLRLLESHSSLDGDNGWLKLADGTVQGIEHDRVRNPQPMTSTVNEWTHGIQTDKRSRALNYAVHKRTTGGTFEFERIVPAYNMLWHGYFGRYDQVRGISPITSSLNLFRDVHENFDYALAKAKLTQIFALAILRSAGAEGSTGKISGGEDEDGNEDKSDYDIKFGDGPIVVDLDHGDSLQAIESQQPSAEFQNFNLAVMMAALKGLDIPFSFYDEGHTNFFGSKGAWFHYERSCKFKRDQLAELLDSWTLWRTQLAILDGELKLPRGKVITDIDWLWVPRGMPWWDPAKEIRGDVMAIGAGLDNPQRICRERDRGDFYDNIDKTAEAIGYAKSKGVPISFNPTQAPVEVVTSD